MPGTGKSLHEGMGLAEVDGVFEDFGPGKGCNACRPVGGAVVDDDDMVDVLAGRQHDGPDGELFVVGRDDRDDPFGEIFR